MMTHRIRLLLATACVAALWCAAAAATAAPPRLRAEGTKIVDPAGRPVALKGVNLGNWLILETWMTAWPQEDQTEVFAVLDERFGEAERRRLMDLWREGYVAPRDLKLARSFGFNVVRVPFDYRLLRSPDDAVAFEWLDRALQMAEDADLYVILDLHGAPGGQSNQHHTGQANQDKLWDSQADQDATVALWKRLADRYKGRDVVAAYDLLNEPWSDYRRDVRPQLKNLMLRCLDAVRAAGDDHVVLLPGSLQDNVRFYGDLRAEIGDDKMRNVGFTHHFYPGLFGDSPTLASHARTLGVTFPGLQTYLDQQRAPFLVGEFNVVQESTGGDRVMRAYYDDFARRGWMTTAWSYKLLKPEAGVRPDNWYFVTNADPLATLDLKTAGLGEIETWFKSLATMPLAADEELRDALTSENPPPLVLPPVAALPERVPQTSPPAGWTLYHIGDAPAGVEADGDALTVVAGGSDIFAAADSFGLLARPIAAGQSITATLAELLDSDRYAKAGLMVRGGPDPDSPAAPFVLLNAFPDGSVSLASRRSAGANATETKFNPGPLPTTLRLSREGGDVVASVGQGGKWFVAGRVKMPGDAVAGLAVCSHAGASLTRARFENVTLGATPSAATVEHLDPAKPRGKNLLKNGSFEAAGSSDTAAGWDRWGQWINRETAWTPTHDGTAMIGYHHWQRDSADDSGMWQDVAVTPGERYEFGLFAHADAPTDGGRATLRVTIALEALADGKPVLVASRDADVASLESAGGWSLLTVNAVAPTSSLRVLIRVAPSEQGPRAGAVKLDDSFLRRDPAE